MLPVTKQYELVCKAAVSHSDEAAPLRVERKAAPRSCPICVELA